MKYSKNNSDEIGASIDDERALLAFLELIKEGYSLEEIPSKLDSKIPPQTLRRIAKRKNMWFSKEELTEFRNQKKLRDSEEATRIKQEELRLEQEEKARRKAQKEKEMQEYLDEIEQKKRGKKNS